MVSIGSVIGGSFRLFREQPVALVLWAALATVLAALSGLLLLEVVRPSAAAAPNGMLLQFVAVFLPYYLLAIVFGVIQTAAAFRALMRPDDSRIGFLRVGMDELRVFGMGALWSAAFTLFYLLLVAFGVVLGRMLYADGSGVWGWGMIPALLFLLSPIYCLMIWLHIRLSPALPLTILRRSFVLGEAWRATKGEFWRLFAAYAVIVMLLMVVYLAGSVITAGDYWTAILEGASPAVAAGQGRVLGPLMIVGWFVNGAISAIAYALWAGAFGTATQQLIGADGGIDYAETFG